MPTMTPDTTTITTVDLPTFIQVPATSPEGYWGGWAVIVQQSATTILLVTRRTGRDGRSDAQYIVDRLASGLHFGTQIIPVQAVTA